MKSTTKLVSLLLAGALALGLAGCSGSDTTWSVEYDGQKLPAGVYIFNLLDAYNEASTKVEDTTADLLTQQVEGQDASQWITAKAKEYTNEYIAIEREAAKRELTLGDAENDYVSYLLEQQWTYMGDAYTANGVSKDSVKLALENAIKRSLIFENTYAANGTNPVPEEEILTYYQENFARCEYIALSKKNGTAALEGDALQAVKDEMQTYIDRANAGENFEEIIQSYRVAHTPEGQEVTTGGYESVVDKASTSYPQMFRDQLFGAAIGEPVSAEDDDYFYLLLRLDLAGDGKDLENRRNSILSALRMEEFTATLADLTAQVTDASYNDAVLKTFTPKKVKLG